MQTDTQAPSAGSDSRQLLTEAIPNTRQQLLFDFSMGLLHYRRSGNVLSIPNVWLFKL
jgi:hypothetical protein